MMLLFTSFDGFETKVGSASADRDDMARELYTAHFCSALLLACKETLQLCVLMEDGMGNEH